MIAFKGKHLLHFLEYRFFRDKMFPAFGFGAQIPPSFQVIEHVILVRKTIKNVYFRRGLYILF